MREDTIRLTSALEREHSLATIRWPRWEDLQQLTFQVGLVGSDGIVVASDRRILSVEPGQVDDYGISNSTKFCKNAELAGCWSGQAAAKFAAQAIGENQEFSKENVQGRLLEFGNSAWNLVWGDSGPAYAGQGARSTVIIAFANGIGLWELEVF